MVSELLRIDRYGVRTIIGLVDPNETVRHLKHIIPQRNHDKLRILRPLLDVVRHDANSPKIERSVDFVGQHDGAWLDGREKPSLRTPN